MISITKKKTLYEGHLIWMRKERVRERGRGDHFEKVILRLNFEAFTIINPKVLTTRCDKR